MNAYRIPSDEITKAPNLWYHIILIVRFNFI